MVLHLWRKGVHPYCIHVLSKAKGLTVKGLKMDFSHLHQYMKDETGRTRTQSLFWEYRINDAPPDYAPLFTLKDREHHGLPSLKKIYMSYEHIPGQEYEFAIDVFNSWDQWQAICNNKLLAKEINKWKNEYDVRLRAKAMKTLIRNALEDGAKGVASAKYLAEGAWIGKRGRPSKEEVQRELKLQASLAKEFNHDIERIGLTIINGGK